MRVPIAASRTRAISFTAALALLAGCEVDRAAAPDAGRARPELLPTAWSEWSAPVNLGPVVNSQFTEQGSAISKDGLSLFFQSDRPGGFGGFDMYVSQRSCTDDANPDCAWGAPMNLGDIVNSASNDNAPKLSPDEHWLYFASPRPGGLGSIDIYVAHRHDRDDDFGWEAPVNLGAPVNSPALENQPEPFNDGPEGALQLYFSSNRLPSQGANDIWVSTMGEDGTFGPPSPVAALNSAADDLQPEIRRDGLELFMGSTRAGGFGLVDLYVSTRASTSDPWSVPVNIGGAVNTSAIEARPAISWDGTTLYFQSQRSGNFDFYRTTRHKVKGE